MSAALALEIIDPALLMTVQDAGRWGWQAYGVPVSGPMDAFAYRAVNLLVGNSPQAAAVEIGLSSASLACLQDCLVAVGGPGFALRVDGRPMRMWTAVHVRRHWVIEVEKRGEGNWAYLAVHGGIDTPLVLGSRSTYLRAALGPAAARPLAAGDRLPVGQPSRPLLQLASRTLDPACLPYAPAPMITVIPGPQAGLFAPDARAAFLAADYVPSLVSDRSGTRLEGLPIAPVPDVELISEGMARGCVQVPPGGLPIVMQADCPTVGGYAKIAAVISADQPLLSQVPLGSGRLRFAETGLPQAQARYRAQLQALSAAVRAPYGEGEAPWPG